MKRTLAIDPGATMGWADALGSGVEDWSDDRRDDWADRWRRFQEWLRRRIHMYGYQAVVYEKGFHRGPYTLLQEGFEVVLLMEARRAGLRVMPVRPAALKKWATGDGRAKKPAMIAAANARWPDLAEPVADDNEADALLLLAWAEEGEHEGRRRKDEG